MTENFPKSLCELLAHCAITYGERPCIASRKGLRTWTMSFRDLDCAALSVANALVRDHGLRKGKRVVLIAPSGVRAVAALFGLFRAGIVAVPLDLNSTPGFVDAVCAKTDAAAIIAPRERDISASVPLIALEDVPLGSTAESGPPEPGPDEIAEIVFTSGTTGDPKGVVLTHLNILSDLQGAAQVVPPGETMRMVSILPLSHMFEQTIGLFLPMWKGGVVYYAPSLSASAIASEIRRRRATGMVVVPRVLDLFLASAEDKLRSHKLGYVWDLQQRIAARLPMPARRILFLPLHHALGGRLRYFLSGGAPLPEKLMEAWERTGVRIIEGYGATECAPVILSNGFDDRASGTVGRPIEGVTVRLSDEGELQVRGANVFGGYWEDPESTKAAFTADGWYRTDDVAEQVGNGRFRIRGRLSECIVLPSGMNVYPADIEIELARQPEIQECAVVGVADGQGNRLHAVLRLADGAGKDDASRAIDRANAGLASHQRLTGFTVWQGEFPKTALQKIKRKVLKRSLEESAGNVVEASPAEPRDMAARLLRRIAPSAPVDITPDLRLDTDLGIDSLGRIELVAATEMETGREFPEDLVAELATVGDLANLLAAPAPAAPPASLPGWPRSPVAVLARRILQPVLLFLPHWLFARPYRVTGQVPPTIEGGPFLFVANHASHTDTLAILRALPSGLRRRIAVAAAADYFFSAPVAAFLSATVLAAFPFSREGRVRSSMEHCGILTDEGWSILIYPEGTRSQDGRLLPFKPGIGLLSLGLDVPVVPIAVTGGATLLPKGATWPRRARVDVRFGQPLPISPEMTVEEATALIETNVAKLLASAERSQNEECEVAR